MFRVFAINVYKIGLLFKGSLAYDQHGGLLRASSNEKYWGGGGGVPDSDVFDKLSTVIRITADMLNGHVSLP